MASLVAYEVGAAALVCLGYPFNSLSKPSHLSAAHLETIATPTLILQGEKDPSGTRDEVADYSLSKAITTHWWLDCNHDLGPRKKSGRTHAQNLVEAINRLTGFLLS